MTISPMEALPDLWMAHWSGFLESEADAELSWFSRWYRDHVHHLRLPEGVRPETRAEFVKQERHTRQHYSLWYWMFHKD